MDGIGCGCRRPPDRRGGAPLPGLSRTARFAGATCPDDPRPLAGPDAVGTSVRVADVLPPGTPQARPQGEGNPHADRGDPPRCDRRLSAATGTCGGHAP